ncbi:MAG: hypothetical protein DRI34_08660 [Deltaproteobacteria bacterium]|nr:MAG: hypothetical protein DRI34_08660 [Deltaproteobacteria bacterium]
MPESGKQNESNSALASSDGRRESGSSRQLQLWLRWGDVVLDNRLLGQQPSYNLSTCPGALPAIIPGLPASSDFKLVEPGQHDGCTIRLAPGMQLEVWRAGTPVTPDALPAQEDTRVYYMGRDENCLVRSGQLLFELRYTEQALPIRSGHQGSAGRRLLGWLLGVLVVFLGLLILIWLTPENRVAAAEYLHDPSRFARLAAISPRPRRDRVFRKILAPRKQNAAVEQGRWRRSSGHSRPGARRSGRRRQDDKTIATHSGVLELLKEHGQGNGDAFGGNTLDNLDRSLDDLPAAGLPDSRGFPGPATRGSSPGGGDLGIGGIRGNRSLAGAVRWPGTGIDIGRRGRHNVSINRLQTRVVGGLDKKLVGRTIARYWSRFKYCYEKELGRDPNLYGKIVVSFVINGNGRVGEASVLSSSMTSTSMEQCLLRAIRQIHFPAPRGGGEVIVTYPFLFTTAG